MLCPMHQELTPLHHHLIWWLTGKPTIIFKGTLPKTSIGHKNQYATNRVLLENYNSYINNF
jgi:hypothetical protein